jgi:ComF family protein
VPGLQVWSFESLKLIWSILDLLFPPVCAGCGKPGTRWCLDCQNRLVSLPEPICEVCGIPQRKHGICALCLTSRPPYDELRSWAVFEGPVRSAIHRLKYRRDIGLGEALASPLKKFVLNCGWQIDMVIPVPLSTQRYRERGYNQIALVANPLSMQLGLVYSSKALIRTKHTRSQVGLSALERKTNVEDAFLGNTKLVTGKSILLMDDVSTTGATISSGSTALKKSGASKVFALTLA